MVRIIPPPRGIGTWQIWSVSRYADRTERLVGRYRWKWIAALIAGRLPRITTEYATFEVRRAVPVLGCGCPNNGVTHGCIVCNWTSCYQHRDVHHEHQCTCRRTPHRVACPQWSVPARITTDGED